MKMTLVGAAVTRCGRTAGPPELTDPGTFMGVVMPKLAPPAIKMKTPVRAALRGRPDLVSREFFSEDLRGDGVEHTAYGALKPHNGRGTERPYRLLAA